MKHNDRFGFLVIVAIFLSLFRPVTGIAQVAPIKPPRLAVPAAARVTCSPDGAFFASATAEGRITYGHSSDGMTLRTFYQCHPQALEFSPDGALLASAGTSNGGPGAHQGVGHGRRQTALPIGN